jgi:hypothetical protein
MNPLDELDIINKLRMYYDSDIYANIAGKDINSINITEKQKYLFDKIFIDKDKVFTAQDIIAFLKADGDIENASGDINSLLSSILSSDDEAKDDAVKLFSIDSYKDSDFGSSPAFGDVAFEIPIIKNAIITTSQIEASLTSGGKEIMLLHVKDKMFHPAIHSTLACETFFNYIPTIERSRCSPEFSVEIFSSGRSYHSQGTTDTSGEISAEESGADSLDSIAVLRFLTDEQKIEKEDWNSADGSLTKSSQTLHTGTTTTESKENADGVNEEVVTIKPKYTVKRDGMEMFTMPQSLMSKKPNFDIDPFRPFMSLKTAKITTESVGEGILAYNTATLEVELYDRHRMNDISFFLDPKKFGKTQFKLTAGWSHQDPSSTYGKYLNKMRTSEMYELVSSDFKFNNSGVITISMKLAMQGSSNITNSSMFAADPEGQSIRELHATLEGHLRAVQVGTTILNSERAQGNLLPTSIITQAEGSASMSLNTADLSRIISGLSSARDDIEMSDEARAEFTSALNSLNSGELINYYSALDRYVTTFMTQVGLAGLGIEQPGRELIITGDSRYRYRYHESKWWSRDTQESEIAWTDLSGNTEAIDVLHAEFPDEESQAEQALTGDVVRFDKLFLNAIASRILTGVESAIDEIHIFMYPFNSRAPGVSGSNIGTFKVNSDRIANKLREKVRETQNLTIQTFIEEVRSIMKDKLDPEFALFTAEEVNSIRATRELITTQTASATEIASQIQSKSSAKAAATDDDRKTEIQEEIDTLQDTLDDHLDNIQLFQEDLTERQDSAVNGEQLDLRISSLSMPELKVSLETKKITVNITTDGVSQLVPRTILRVHVYDGNNKPNELQEFLSNLNNNMSIVIPDENDTIEESPWNAELVQTLSDLGIGEIKTITGRGNTTIEKFVVNNMSPAIKQATKDSMASITYGSSGTAINSVSVDSVTDRNMQAHYMLQSQTADHSTLTNEELNIRNRDAQKVMPLTITMDMMGCPLLRYGQEFYVDFDTNTDLDNVYVTTSIIHSIAAGKFTTSLSLKPTFKTSASFGQLLGDIHFVANQVPTSSE